MSNFEEAVRDLEKVKTLDPGRLLVYDSNVATPGLRQKLQDAKLELKKSKRKDYYKILEVSKDAGESDIRKAYKGQALKWHPDKHSSGEEHHKVSAEKMFKDISEAYTVLSDQQKK